MRPIEPHFDSGLNELFVVQRKAACEPLSIGIGTRHYSVYSLLRKTEK
jgi:hypothetical protein